MARLIALHGDAYLCRSRYGEIVEDLKTQDVLRLTGRDQPEEAIEAGRMLGLMDPARVVRIDGAMTAQTGQRRNARRVETGWTKAIATMAGLPETTTYIWVDSEIPKSDPTLKQIADHGEVESLEPPKGPALRDWVKRETETHGGSIDNAACGELISRAGDDLWRLSRECEKIALYCDGREAGRADIAALVEENLSDTIFAAVDAIFSGDVRKCARIAEGIVDAGQTPFYVLTMFHREARLIETARQVVTENGSPADMLTALGTRSEFVARKARERARALGRAGVTEWYDTLLQADRAIKTGALEAEEAMYWAIGALGAGTQKRR